MTKLEQAIEWWKNQNKHTIKKGDIPVHHLKVLNEHDKIKFHLGSDNWNDYYTLK